MNQLAERSPNPYQSPTSLTDDFSDFDDLDDGFGDDFDKDIEIEILRAHIEMLRGQLLEVDIATLLLFLGITMISFFIGLNLGN